MTCGVYQIRNTENGKRYVGSSCNIETRFYMHRIHLRRNIHPNRYLQRAWNKYGEEFFEFSILKKCPIEKLLKIEQRYMDAGAEYNLSKTAGRPTKTYWSPKRRKELSRRMKGNKHLLGFRHSEKSKAQMSAKLKGRKLSALTRRKASERMKRMNRLNPPRKGKKCSPAHKEKLRLAKLSRRS